MLRNSINCGLRVAARGAGMTLLAFTAALVFATVAARAEFGVSAFDWQTTANEAGDPYSQAGGHPYAISTEIEFNHHFDPVWEGQLPDRPVKDVLADLPAGLVGDPQAMAKCTSGQLATIESGAPASQWCPIGSQIGIVHLNSGGVPIADPLFNMQAPANVPARFGFNFAGVLVSLDARVRSDGDYGLSIDSKNISEGLPLIGIKVTIWGVPADPSHDQDRCLLWHIFAESSPYCTSSGLMEGPNPAGRPVVPLLTLPSRCTEPGVGLEMKLRADAWTAPGVFDETSFATHLPPNLPAGPGERGAPLNLSGCAGVPFEPTVDTAPTSNLPDTPSGLSFALQVPSEGLENVAGIAQSDLRRAVVALPEGVAANPSSADGLGACSSTQIALHSTGDASCPENSKIGTILIETPLLEAPLAGSVYLAAPGDNPFGSLLAVYLVADGQGVTVKVPGKIEADPVTGRLTAVFDSIPQLPFAKLTLTLKGGPRAPLVTPAACGSTPTTSTLTGWNGKTANISSPYSVECTPGLGAFSPAFTAGTVNNQAGAFTPLVLSLSREDREQNLSGLNVTLPPGLSAKLAGVPLCPDTQASAGTCGEASRIGTVTATAGAGPNPYAVQGKIFLTGPYNNGPFGEVVVIPAVAGPFNLGNVIVRGSIRIDPHTAQASVISDPFPTILQGIPLRTRSVNVTLDRPGFIFNPTNCDPLSVDGTITSTQGASAAVSSHFQAANCAALPFKPTFKVATKATSSKKNGASLDVKITSGAGQANLGKVAVTLPKQLPSWLPTIQQACPAAVFNANPASCPAGSNIGIATATTPILANPVTGPVYLVSHGGAAFPDIVMVLQGEGVTVEQVGSINIKGQVTSSAFNSIPDVPLNTFELVLPQGPHPPSHKPPREGQGQLLRAEPRHADDAHWAERGADQAEHEDRRHWLPQGQGEEEAQETPQEEGQEVAGERERRHASSQQRGRGQAPRPGRPGARRCPGGATWSQRRPAPRARQ